MSLFRAMLTGGEMQETLMAPVETQVSGLALASPDQFELADLFSQLHAVSVVVVPAVAAEPTPAPVPTVEAEDAAAATAYVVTAPTAYGSCPATIIEVFGPNAPAACAVSYCESGWNPDATGAAGERGWFQIHPYWHSDATYDPLGNTLAAYRISSGGYDWSQWTCQP